MTAEDLVRTLKQLATKVSKRVDKVRDSTSAPSATSGSTAPAKARNGCATRWR